MWIDYFQNLFIVLFMLSLIVTGFMLFCRDSRHFYGLDKEKDKIFWHAFITRLYFVLITFTTIGYGDISPRTIECRILTIFIILSVFILVLKVFDSIIDVYKSSNLNYLYLSETLPPNPTTPLKKITIDNK
jgi:hypothetical protein